MAPSRCLDELQTMPPTVRMTVFLLFAAYAVDLIDRLAIGNALPFLHDGTSGYIASALLFLALAVVLARAAQKKVM